MSARYLTLLKLPIAVLYNHNTLFVQGVEDAIYKTVFWQSDDDLDT